MRNQCGRDQNTTDSLLLQHNTFSPQDTLPKEDFYRANLLTCADVGDTFCLFGECVDRLETASEASYGPVCACPAGTFGTLKDGCTNCPAGWYRGAGELNLTQPLRERFGTAPCKACQTGFAADEGSSRCELCESGRYIADRDSPTCQNCVAGKYKKYKIASEEVHKRFEPCTSCPRGFAANPGSEKCSELQQTFSVGSTQAEISEGGEHILATSFFTTQANDKLTVTFTTSDEELCPLSQSSILIQGTANEIKTGSITIQTSDDDIDAPNKKCSINVTAKIENFATFEELVVLTVKDNDVAGIHITSPSNKRTVVIKEGGTSFDYNVTLTSEPKDAAVVVEMKWVPADDRYATDRITVQPKFLTFTPATWSKPQLVRIQPV
jgi:hypothetical protein